ncbi:LysE family translocator [Catalinimonas sp. 4WD22]|uniref:LysE family translocator n=1 Tax=Catalinimonas locisalis TaxID=3133978 RepID=UPI003100D379
MGIINFETFLIAGILLNLTPGADTMYILGRSISQGKKAGVLSALGICSGALIHCIFAALGLSIILAKSALAFEVVKYLGAAYLVYLGYKSLRAKATNLKVLAKQQPANYAKIYASGIFTNVLNPKVALFFIAFIPQFVDPQYAESSLPFLLLGLTFLTTATIWCLILSLCSARLSEGIRKRPKIKLWLDRVTGGMFIVLGLKLALTRR